MRLSIYMKEDQLERLDNLAESLAMSRSKCISMLINTRVLHGSTMKVMVKNYERTIAWVLREGELSEDKAEMLRQVKLGLAGLRGEL